MVTDRQTDRHTNQLSTVTLRPRGRGLIMWDYYFLILGFKYSRMPSTQFTVKKLICAGIKYTISKHIAKSVELIIYAIENKFKL